MALRENSGETPSSAARIAQWLEDRRELPRSLHGAQGSVIVAVVAVRMVQVSVNKVADVIPVRHCFVPAPRTMNVPW